MILPKRRGFLLGAAALLAAPSIVRASSLMPVVVPEPVRWSVEVTPPRKLGLRVTGKLGFWVAGRDEFGAEVHEFIEAGGPMSTASFRSITDADPGYKNADGSFTPFAVL